MSNEVYACFFGETSHNYESKWKMTEPIRSFKLIDRLTADQIAQFKRDGFLILEGILDRVLCRQARDGMWEAIETHLPRLKRDDPSTWTAITEEENTELRAMRPEGGGDPYFSGGGHQFFIRNGASELMLNLAPRALWGVAEQLLGTGDGGMACRTGRVGLHHRTVLYVRRRRRRSQYTSGRLNGLSHQRAALRQSLRCGCLERDRCGSMGRALADCIARFRIVLLTLPTTTAPIPTVRATARGGCRCRHTSPMCRRTAADLPFGPGATRASGVNSGRLSKPVRNIRTNIWRYERRADIPTPSSGKSRRILNRSIVMGLPARSSCGTRKSCTLRDRTRLTTLSAKQQSTDLRKRPSRFPTRSRWMTRMATFGGIGRMRCVCNR